MKQNFRTPAHKPHLLKPAGSLSEFYDVDHWQSCGLSLRSMTKKKKPFWIVDGKHPLLTRLSLFVPDRLLRCDVEKNYIIQQKILCCVNLGILKRKLGTALRGKKKNNGSCIWMMQIPYFSGDKGGGQTPGIIVTRATGCPEEEVRAELYASIQGQRGWRVGAFHLFPSTLSRVSRQNAVASSPKDAVTPSHQAAGLEFTVKLHRLTQVKSAAMKGTRERKIILDCRKLEPCRSVFLISASGLFFSQRFRTANG